MGPFESYSPPGVYTRTLFDPAVASLLGELRIPVLLGVGDELLVNEGWEMVRGSSAVADNLRSNEDVSSQLDGTNTSFFVSNFPIVDGTGMGRITNNPNDVSVTINGDPAGIRQVVGSTGEIFLTTIPFDTDVVRVTYYYKKTDTLITDEDLSIQVDGTRKEFKVFHLPIVDGSNGGRVTSDVTKVTVKVNGVMIVPREVDGANGFITLPSAPVNGSELLVTYYTNTHQDTFDYLPHANVTEITAVGFAPGRQDYIQGTDFVLVDDTIHWGHSYRLYAGYNTPGFEYFDDTQITGLLISNRRYMDEASGVSDSTNKTFTVSSQMTEGDGNGTPTHNPARIMVYVGATPIAAFAGGEVPVESVDGVSRTVMLKTAPAPGDKVYVTYSYSMMSDDVFTFQNKLAGGFGVGEYTITSRDNGELATFEESGIQYNGEYNSYF